MKPSEVIAMRDKLAEMFDVTFGREVSGSELADWLIEYEWVTEVPSE